MNLNKSHGVVSIIIGTSKGKVCQKRKSNGHRHFIFMPVYKMDPEDQAGGI